MKIRGNLRCGFIRKRWSRWTRRADGPAARWRASEFIEKAVRFYLGYLSAGNDASLLPNAFLSNMKSIVAESDNRQSRLLFKLSVEMAMMMNLLASMQDVDDVTLNRLRGECVKEVKRLNGSFSLDDAMRWQRG